MRSRTFISIAMLWVLVSLLRFVFATYGMAVESMLDVEVSTTVFWTLNGMFLLIGITGLVTILGFWQRKKWDYWGLVLVSVITIIFDEWDITIQA